MWILLPRAEQAIEYCATRKKNVYFESMMPE